MYLPIPVFLYVLTIPSSMHAERPKRRVRACRLAKRAKEDEIKVEIKTEIKTEVSEGGTDEFTQIKSEIVDEIVDEVKSVKSEPEVEDIEDMGPPHWRMFLSKVREMRSMLEAPVDTVGCASLGKSTPSKDAKIIRFNHLVALMLSSQTKDQVTGAAVYRLRQLPNGLTPSSVLEVSEQELADIIYPVGFFRRKAKYIQSAAKILIENYNSDIPRTIEEITALPGVGPKMGYLLLQSAWNDVSGIGVDVHVHRLATLWKWVPPNGTPEKTRKSLESWLPRELWAEINPLLVGFGQTWCPPRASKRACDKCLLKNDCPASLHTK